MPKVLGEATDLSNLMDDSANKKSPKTKVLRVELPPRALEALVDLKIKNPQRTTSAIVAAALQLASRMDTTKVAGEHSKDALRKLVLDEIEIEKRAEKGETEAMPEPRKPAQKKSPSEPSRAQEARGAPEPGAEPGGQPEAGEKAAAKQSKQLTDKELFEKRKKGEDLSTDEQKRYKEMAFTRMYEIYTSGEKLADVAVRMNEEGWPPIEGGDWDVRSVSSWMNREILPKKTRYDLKLGLK